MLKECYLGYEKARSTSSSHGQADLEITERSNLRKCSKLCFGSLSKKSCWKTEKNHFCTNLSRHQQESNQLLIGFCLDNNFRSKFFWVRVRSCVSFPLQLGSDSLETCWWSYFWIKVFLRIDGKWVFVWWPSSVVSKNWYLLESVNYILASRISLKVLQSTFDFVEHFFVTNGKGLVHFGRNSSETLNWPFF